MHRLRRLIVLLIVGVLGIQTGAFAAHAHLAAAWMPAGQDAPGALHTASQHTADHHHAQADADNGSSHHSASCASAHSCFPVGNAPPLAATAPALLPVAPEAAPSMAVPASPAERLLRPPRLHG